MKITQKQWEEIREYIYKHSREIWDLAVRHTSSIHDAIVWLDGIMEGKYKLWAGMYTTGTVEHPDNSLLVYRLKRGWKNSISDYDLCIVWEDGRPKRTVRDDKANYLSPEEYEAEVYKVGYDLFLDELKNDWFWEEFTYVNKFERKEEEK